MIAALAIVSCAVTSWLRLAAGAWSPFVPWLGLAWTLLFARHSRRAAFGLLAVLLGLIDGLVAPAPWTIWPLLQVLIGTAAFATRRVLPVRGLLGELAIGAAAASIARALALPFRPMELQLPADPALSWILGAASTGVATSVLVSLSHHWVALRMRLQKV